MKRLLLHREFAHLENHRIFFIKEGKSTLSKIIIGIINMPQNVYFNGYPMDQLNMYELRKKLLAVLKQKIQFPYEIIGKLLGHRNIEKCNSKEFEKIADEVLHLYPPSTYVN